MGLLTSIFDAEGKEVSVLSPGTVTIDGIQCSFPEDIYKKVRDGVKNQPRLPDGKLPRSTYTININDISCPVTMYLSSNAGPRR